MKKKKVHVHVVCSRLQSVLLNLKPLKVKLITKSMAPPHVQFRTMFGFGLSVKLEYFLQTTSITQTVLLSCNF